MKNFYGVDINQVVREAKNQKINFREITLFYKDLSDSEIGILKEKNLLKDSSKVRIFGQIDELGNAYFPEKIAEVYYLGA